MATLPQPEKPFSQVVAAVTVQLAPDYACVRVATGDDDAEERDFSVDVGSSDELVKTPNLGAQVIGLRFSGLDIPQGATITSAYLQFTVDENNNTSPCNLTVYGQNTDDAQTFSELDDTNVSGSPKPALP